MLEQTYTRDEAVAVARAKPPAKWEGFGNRSETADRDHHWDFGIGYDGAVELSAKGFEVDESFSVPLVASTSSEGKTRRGLRRSTEGESADIDRILDGDELAYRRRQKIETPSLTWIVDIGVPWHVTADQMRNRGSAIFCAIEKLEAEGVTVAVIARLKLAGGSDPGDLAAEIKIEIKRPGEYLDRNVLAYWLSHPAAFRRIGFKLIEQCPISIGKKLGGSYGICWFETPSRTADTICSTFPPDTGYFKRFSTKEGAEKEISEQLEKLG